MFFSIRWKIVFVAGLVLAGMAVLFSLQQKWALNAQFGNDVMAHRERLRAMSERLFMLQNDRLQVLARMLAETPSVREAMRAHDAAAMAAAVAPLWPELNLGQGLSGLLLLDADQRALGGWGELDEARLAGLARQAVAREMPQTWLACSAAQCLHQIVLPVGERGRTLGSVALVAGLEGLVLDLRRMGGAEVAILANGGQGARARAAHPLEGMRLLSLSGDERARAVLREGLDRTWHAPYYQAHHGRETWVILPFHPDLPGDGLMHMAVIADVTAASEAIHQGLWRNLAWGIGVLLFSMVLMFFLLHPAMRRIERVSRLLPLLGEGRFQEVKEATAQGATHRLSDEMHGLERLAADLAHQLQSLNEANQLHASALAAQARQLEQERDFITGLLDTAPVLIVTYGRDCRIRMANAYAVVDSGVRRSQLIGHAFGEFFMGEAQRIEHRRQLGEMQPGDVTHGEGSFLREDGQWRDIVWFHSCLDDSKGERLYLSVGLDVTEHRLAEQRLQLLVDHDSVTGLLNRRTFKRDLEALLAGGGKGLLLVCDIDEFRALNDVEGHEAGDRILMSFAQHLQRLDPIPAMVARLGSDEFALVFQDLSTVDAIQLARQLNRVVSSQTVGQEGEEVKRHFSTSVGLVLFPDYGADADSLLGNAELALAHARAKGHGSWHLYSDQEAYRESADRRAYWREEVESALEEGRFVLHFQPIVQVATGKVIHHEALLRMIGRDGKLVPPGHFIDVAESTGLIRRIDRWVLEAAVAAAAHHREAKIALNLSSRSFDDDVAFETMQTALLKHRVAGERLLLEITETAALANFSGAKRIMDKFQGLGCVFGLDDFGVGYSSFQYLKELPVGFVKIDGSFIKNLTQNPDDVVFVRALNGAVQGFGKTTVAEFVEDEETLAILAEIGVDHAQGYLFGKPAAELVDEWGGAAAAEAGHPPLNPRP
ncbi:MAG: EAL domain-containing protein [Pseudomonadota bacterium]